MYRIMTILIVLLFSNTINAQDKEEYDKAVDYCACKIAFAYTEDYAKKNPTKDENVSFNEVIKTKIENCDKNTLNVSDLEILLKENNFKGFSKTFIPEAQNAKEKFTDKLTKTKAIEIIISSFKTSFEKIDIKEDMKRDLNKRLNSFKNSPKNEYKTIVAPKTNLNNEINRLENLINSKKDVKNNSFIPNWLLLILILLSSTFLFIYNYLKNKKLNERIDRRLSKDEYEQTKSPFNQSNNHNNHNSQFERSINQKITDLNYAIEKLQKENLSNQNTQQKQVNIKTNTQQSNKQQSPKFIYAKTPIAEKTFNAFDVTENKEGKFYKFIIKNNSNQIEFEFFNTENSAKRAVNGPDAFLYRVCEEIEPLNQNATKIITKEPGIAIKQDDKWIVTKKARIAYE